MLVAAPEARQQKTHQPACPLHARFMRQQLRQERRGRAAGRLPVRQVCHGRLAPAEGRHGPRPGVGGRAVDGVRLHLRLRRRGGAAAAATSTAWASPRPPPRCCELCQRCASWSLDRCAPSVIHPAPPSSPPAAHHKAQHSALQCIQPRAASKPTITTAVSSRILLSPTAPNPPPPPAPPPTRAPAPTWSASQ
jgi:hypothetical protein